MVNKEPKNKRKNTDRLELGERYYAVIRNVNFEKAIYGIAPSPTDGKPYTGLFVQEDGKPAFYRFLHYSITGIHKTGLKLEIREAARMDFSKLPLRKRKSVETQMERILRSAGAWNG